MSNYLVLSNLMKLATQGKKLPDGWNKDHVDTLRKPWEKAVKNGEKRQLELDFFDCEAYGNNCPMCSKPPKKIESEVKFGDHVLGIHIYYSLECKCDIAYSKQIEIEKRKAESLKYSEIPETYRELTWSSWDRSVDDKITFSYNRAKSFTGNHGLKNLLGNGVVLYGNVGRGKTLIGICLLKSIIENTKLKCKYIPMADLTNKVIKFGQDGDYLEKVAKNDVIFLDDLDKLSTSSSWVQERVFSLFDNIFRSKKTLIISTNLRTIPEMETYFGSHGEAIISRMVDKMEFIGFIGGEDYRKKRRMEKINHNSVDNQTD